MKDFFESDSVPSPKETQRRFMEFIKRSNEEIAKEKAKLRNPALEIEPVQRALKELPVGYRDNPSFKSDGMLESEKLASLLSRSGPPGIGLKTLFEWLPPGYLQDREEFGALSDESLHEHIRRVVPRP